MASSDERLARGWAELGACSWCYTENGDSCPYAEGGPGHVGNHPHTEADLVEGRQLVYLHGVRSIMDMAKYRAGHKRLARVLLQHGKP